MRCSVSCGEHAEIILRLKLGASAIRARSRTPERQPLPAACATRGRGDVMITCLVLGHGLDAEGCEKGEVSGRKDRVEG